MIKLWLVNPSPSKAGLGLPWVLKRVVWLLLVVTLLPGCGFQLRGAVDIPAARTPVFVEASGASVVAGLLRERLKLSGVPQASQARDARVIVRVQDETRRTRVGALDRHGKIIASELFLTLKFDARDGAGKPLLESRGLELSRTFENPDVEVLGKQQEAAILYAEMAEDATTQVLAMLRAALTQSG